jgi:two-component sensor histidine kinase
MSGAGGVRSSFLARLLVPIGDDKGRFSRTLLALLVMMALLGMVALVASFFVFENVPASITASVILLAVCLVSFLFLFSGRPGPAGAMLIVATFVFTFMLVLFSGGIRSMDLVYFYAACIAAGTLFGPRRGMLAAVASALGGVALLVLEYQGLLPDPIFPIPPPAALANFLMALVMAVTVLQVSERSKHAALAQARNELEERRAAEDRLRRSLTEKDALLAELYHRTRNNMQLITSFLRLESDRFPGQDVKTAFAALQGRIRSMALVHERLAAGGDPSLIDLLEYARELARYLSGGANEVIGRVSIEVSGDRVPLLVDTAIPCGLILHELLSNSLRHAFPGERSGRVLVRIVRESEAAVLIEVSDDGIGMPETMQGSAGDSLGLLLVRSLAEQQLSGSVEFLSSGGVVCRVRLRTDLFSARI